MIKFDAAQFARMLSLTPEVQKTADTALIHSEYLQKNIFDKLRAGNSIKLKDIEWDAFELCHVTPGSDQVHEKSRAKGWTMGFNHFVHEVHPSPDSAPKFV